MTEQWRDIPGYDGDYQVSDHGRVKSLKFDKERILKGGRMGRGYPSVLLTKNGQPSTHYVHRLVAAAFLPSDDDRPHVNHVDGNRQNNHVSNLEWCTQAENSAHARDVLGFKPTPPVSSFTPEEIRKIAELRRNKVSPKVIAAKFGVTTATIQKYMREFAPDVLYNSKLSTADIPRIQDLRKQGYLLREIAAVFEVSESHICRVLKTNRRTHSDKETAS